MSKNNIKVQEELIKSANLIREKYRALKRGKFIDVEQRLESLKPLTEPLEKLVNKEEKVIVINKRPARPSNLQLTGSNKSALAIQDTDLLPPTPPPKPNTPSPYTYNPPRMIFGHLATKYLSYYLESNDKKNVDTTFGLRKEQGTSNFLIGNTKVDIIEDNITVKGKTYKGTDGLWSLLTLKVPDEEKITDEDRANYKEILETTNAHKHGYKPDGKILSSGGVKYVNIIKPMLSSSSKTGDGLTKDLKEVTENPIDYVYWNDPNELVNRLRLLILSREAGNTGVGNEITSIIEELRESGIIL